MQKTDIIKDEQNKIRDTILRKLENPQTIINYLNDYVIEQHDAKEEVAAAFSTYATKVLNQGEKLPKNHMLFLGSTGVGKTYLMQVLAKRAGIPFVQGKLTGKSTEGYKGENLSELFEQVKTAADEDAPHVIVYLDEIDKLARDDWGSGSGFGARIQDELIGWLEEATIIGDKKNPRPINTKNILFILTGAFHGSTGRDLEDIIKKRLTGEKHVGFGMQQTQQYTTQDLIAKITPQDLIEYGLKQELVGRMPSIVPFHPLTTEHKVRILKEAKDSQLTLYENLFKLRGYNLIIEPGVHEVIAERCPKETGARSLNAVCAQLFKRVILQTKELADEKNNIVMTPQRAEQLLNVPRMKERESNDIQYTVEERETMT